MSTAEHSATRHNTAAAAARRPRPGTDCVHEVGRPCTAAPAAVRRPLHRHSPLPTPLHAAHRRQGGQGVYPQTQAMHGSDSAACATEGSGPSARRRTLPGLPATGGRGGPTGTLRSRATSRTAPGTVFPWHAARGFCTPRRRSRPHCRSACPQPPSTVKIRPLGLRPRGLGGAL